MSKNRKNIVSLISIIVCIGVLLAWLISYFVEKEQTQQPIEDIKDVYVVTAEPITSPTPEPVVVIETPEKNVVIDGVEYPGFEGLEVPARDIDFAGLQREENEHIYAWIYIPNTNVDYPILQHPDDLEYYLKYNTKGKRVTAGSIFTQYYNNKDFNDNNTVIYGHNMRNGTMFKTLHYFEDSKFFEENPYVYIYTENDIRVYQIFGAYEYSDIHLLMSFDMDNDEAFGDYLESLTALNGRKDHFNWELGVTSADKIITLSTCIGNKADQRYLVQAKLIAVEEVKKKTNACFVQKPLMPINRYAK